MLETYESQLDRVQRYLQRFSEINSGREHNQPSDYYEDDVYAFFQNCYHLKDWIKHDPQCASWTPCETLIKKSPNLKLCADICNGLKHFKLTRPPRSTEGPYMGGKNINLKINGDGSEESGLKISIKFEIRTKSGSIDAFKLAAQCVSEWKSYIESNTRN